MYLAPLNFDRYFRKVFSETRIAKRFLEDFFDVQIEEIEALPTRHKATDAASAVEFDFRCRIRGAYVIIDMQQWYKSDIVKRFYMYHSLNTVLQLERIPDKSIDLDRGKKRDVKDYDRLIPVITLIWLADDTMGFKDDFVSFTMTSEAVNDFIRNGTIWRAENVLEILAERERCLGIIDNRAKKLDFLQQNKLVYAFQPNIVANKRFSRYFEWFELAELSRDDDNAKDWFDKYLDDDVFAEIIRRINTLQFQQDDWDYVRDQADFREKVRRYEQGFIQEGIDIGIDIGFDNGFDKGFGNGFGNGFDKGIIQTARNGLAAGLPNPTIRVMTGLTDEQIDALREQMVREGAIPGKAPDA